MRVTFKVFLKLGRVHEIGKTRPELWIFYPSRLQFQPEIRIDRQKQRINPPKSVPLEYHDVDVIAVVTYAGLLGLVSHPTGRFRSGWGHAGHATASDP